MGFVSELIERIKEENKSLRYEIESLEFELQKAYDTIEFMNEDRKEQDKEILSLQDQVSILEKHIKNGTVGRKK